MQAVKEHKYSSVLENVGNSDITSHVDFSALTHIVEKQHVYCAPVVSQRQFLTALGIEHRADALKAAAAECSTQNIDTALQRLIGRYQMGELFKVLCFYNDTNEIGYAPCGFK